MKRSCSAERDTDTRSQRCDEMNLCNYRVQIGLAPHEAALDPLITRCAAREIGKSREREGGKRESFNSFAKNEIAARNLQNFYGKLVGPVSFFSSIMRKTENQLFDFFLLILSN